MDDLEARVRCLEMAERLARAQGKTDTATVVNLQTALYAAVNAEPESVKSPPVGPRGKRGTST